VSVRIHQAPLARGLGLGTNKNYNTERSRAARVNESRQTKNKEETKGAPPADKERRLRSRFLCRFRFRFFSCRHAEAFASPISCCRRRAVSKEVGWVGGVRVLLVACVVYRCWIPSERTRERKWEKTNKTREATHAQGARRVCA
jgi:hypothetical protein